jgi:hypothetical protein
LERLQYTRKQAAPAESYKTNSAPQPQVAATSVPAVPSVPSPPLPNPPAAEGYETNSPAPPPVAAAPTPTPTPEHPPAENYK